MNGGVLAGCPVSYTDSMFDQAEVLVVDHAPLPSWEEPTVEGMDRHRRLQAGIVEWIHSVVRTIPEVGEGLAPNVWMVAYETDNWRQYDGLPHIVIKANIVASDPWSDTDLGVLGDTFERAIPGTVRPGPEHHKVFVTPPTDVDGTWAKLGIQMWLPPIADDSVRQATDCGIRRPEITD